MSRVFLEQYHRGICSYISNRPLPNKNMINILFRLAFLLLLIFMMMLGERTQKKHQQNCSGGQLLTISPGALVWTAWKARGLENLCKEN